MAKKVIQMYDKYKSTTKIYPKIIKECLQKDVTDYIEGQVVANPELAGTEASLTSLEVGGTKYKVEQPINVEANPTLAGTEESLESIEIGDTKYKIGGGGNELYCHNICIGSTFANDIRFTLITNDATAITTATALKNVMVAKGLSITNTEFVSQTHRYVGKMTSGNYGSNTPIYAIFAISDTTNFGIIKRDSQEGITIADADIHDTVETL